MYVNTTTKELISRRQLQLANPNTSLPPAPVDIPALGVAYVHDTYNPPVPFGHVVVSGAPELVDGQWRVSKNVVARDVDGVREGLKSQVTALRKEKETSGIVINGAEVATDITDQNRITSVTSNADLAGVTSINFKAVHGWSTITITELKAIAGAIALHVQACFDAEFAHYQALDQLTTLEDLGAHDVQSGWPAKEK